MIAELMQRNPSLLLVLLVGLPAVTWAAAYGRRPSRARRRVAIGALVVTALVAILATVEAVRAGARWWLAPLCAGAIAAVAALLARARR